MYCKACGKQIDFDSVFCKFCGVAQAGDISPTAKISPASGPVIFDCIEAATSRNDYSEPLKSRQLKSKYAKSSRVSIYGKKLEIIDTGKGGVMITFDLREVNRINKWDNKPEFLGRKVTTYSLRVTLGSHDDREGATLTFSSQSDRDAFHDLIKGLTY